MRSAQCVQHSRLLSRPAHELSDADRLLLESHLAHCEPCRGERAFLSEAARLLSTAQAPLSAAGRQRAMKAALGSRAPTQPRPRLLSAFRFAAPFAAALVSVALWVALSPTPAIAPAPSPEQQAQVLAHVAERPPAAPSSGMPGGSAVLEDKAVGAGAELPSAGNLTAPKGARLRLGHGELKLSPGSDIAWTVIEDGVEVKLTSGSLFASVDPKAQKRFRVETAGFLAEVTGTRFEVTSGAVHVFEGSVRILSADGAVLKTSVGAGERWALGEVGAQKRAATALSEARASLASGKTAGARRGLLMALKGRMSGPERAEAMSLLAECALLEGRRNEAITAYLDVAKRFDGLPAAETALYAATRLETGSRERALLERYLRRHPSGRFAREARDRLAHGAAGR